MIDIYIIYCIVDTSAHMGSSFSDKHKLNSHCSRFQVNLYEDAMCGAV